MKTALVLAALLLAGCGTGGVDADGDRAPQAAGRLQQANIVGSAETPDPVLERVRALEQRGLVTDVVVRESFPVQISLRAPPEVVEELERMPRKGGSP